MKAKPIEQVITICTGISVGVTLKIQTKETPVPFDEDTRVYHRKLMTIGTGFKKLGWNVTEQTHGEDKYLVCAKYVLDPLDFKYIAAATKMVHDFGPVWLNKDKVQY